MNNRDEKKVMLWLGVAVAIVLLVFSLVFFKFPDNSLAEFRFSVDSEGNATVLGYTGSKAKLTIPADDGKGHPVRYIAADAFGSHDSVLKSVVIPDSVVAIGDAAFMNCVNLKSVSFSQNIESIGRKAFAGCTALTGVNLPENLETIGDEAFYGCLRLGRLYIPASVEKIGYDAFAACETLRLDVSDNPLAAEVAEEYHIETGKVNKTGVYFVLIAVITLALGGGVFYGYRYLGKKLAEKKKKEEESA